MVAKEGAGGWGEIRTHGDVAATPVFKTGALNRSATHPHRQINYLWPKPFAIPPFCHLFATNPVARFVHFCSRNLGEQRRFEHGSYSIVPLEQVAVDIRGDRR